MRSSPLSTADQPKRIAGLQGEPGIGPGRRRRRPEPARQDRREAGILLDRDEPFHRMPQHGHEGPVGRADEEHARRTRVEEHRQVGALDRPEPIGERGRQSAVGVDRGRRAGGEFQALHVRLPPGREFAQPAGPVPPRVRQPPAGRTRHREAGEQRREREPPVAARRQQGGGADPGSEAHGRRRPPGRQREREREPAQHRPAALERIGERRPARPGEPRRGGREAPPAGEGRRGHGERPHPGAAPRRRRLARAGGRQRPGRRARARPPHRSAPSPRADRARRAALRRAGRPTTPRPRSRRATPRAPSPTPAPNPRSPPSPRAAARPARRRLRSRAPAASRPIRQERRRGA